MCALLESWFRFPTHLKINTLVTGQIPEANTPSGAVRTAPRCIVLMWLYAAALASCGTLATYLRLPVDLCPVVLEETAPLRVLLQVQPCVQKGVGLYCRDGAARRKRLLERKQHLCSTRGSYSETFWGRCTGQVELRVRLSPESSKVHATVAPSMDWLEYKY